MVSNSATVMDLSVTLAQSSMTGFSGAYAHHDRSPVVPRLASPSSTSASACSQLIVCHFPLPRSPTRLSGWVIRRESWAVWMPACPLRQAMPPARERASRVIVPIPTTASANGVS
ncbi:hypothetical protein GCM10025883_11910 [Mobilicoccus caccae]|uniref:Uncharacterized protein n=1 Tax=Mobilicoccus caccae TaxID=1859295 RepID=A0ABQ6IN37_9MICO|nr:hypothetical protein GCM10025883_11910 [Mobilicoccus caccae]